MARTDIARVVARAVLDEIVSNADENDNDHVDALLTGALLVKRRNMRNVGEVVDLTFVVPPDPTTPEE
jgi:hypothetical protein